MLLNYSQIVFGYAIMYLAPYVTELFLMFLYFFQIRHYVIQEEREATRKILKFLEKETRSVSSKHLYGKELPCGYFFGPHCIGYINKTRGYDSEDMIHILTTTAFYKRLTEKQVSIMKPLLVKDAAAAEVPEEGIQGAQGAQEPLEKQSIQVYSRLGSYTNFYYRSVKLDVSHIQPIGAQIPIVKNIIDLYLTNGRATVFLHGVSCAGKSSVGYLVAKEVKGNFCHTFNPTDPGNAFSAMVQDTRENGDDAPLVVVLEEVDVILRAIHGNKVSLNPKVPTSVTNKGSWSTLLDDMIFYKNIIFILTSNESKEKLDALDPAYLRKGRVDATYEMLEELPLEVF